jgi:hypothetical protein
MEQMGEAYIRPERALPSSSFSIHLCPFLSPPQSLISSQSILTACTGTTSSLTSSQGPLPHPPRLVNLTLASTIAQYGVDYLSQRLATNSEPGHSLRLPRSSSPHHVGRHSPPSSGLRSSPASSSLVHRKRHVIRPIHRPPSTRPIVWCRHTGVTEGRSQPSRKRQVGRPVGRRKARAGFYTPSDPRGSRRGGRMR